MERLRERFELSVPESLPQARELGAKASALASEAVLLNTLVETKSDPGSKRAKVQKEFKVMTLNTSLFGTDVRELMHPRIVSEAVSAVLKPV